MKFAQLLSSQLTPEWRQYYIDYEGLKKCIYVMTDSRGLMFQEHERALLMANEVIVNANMQSEFFDEIKRQLEMVNTFYHGRETELSEQLSKIEDEVAILMRLRENNRTKGLRSTKRKLQSLKSYLREFYLSVDHLQNFQTLNHTGFRKILKKHDKLARSTLGKEFFKEGVCQAEFWTSKSTAQLKDKTETIMIDKLEDGKRRKAMNALRVPPLDTRDTRSHWATLKTGWYMGVIFVSIIVLIVAAVYRPKESWSHVTPVLRGLRAGFILTLWFYAFAFNLFGWRIAGVNSVLIFDIELRDYRNHVQVFEIASLIGVTVVIGAYLTVFSYWLNYPEWVGPLVMFALILIMFVLPIPLLYYTSRIWLAKELARISLAPFFNVTFPDFWIADQVTSLVIFLLDVEYFWCYLFVGIHYPDATIQCGQVTYALRPLIAVLPAWFRFAQCLRRYYDTRKAFPHLANAAKYSTSFFVVFFSSLGSGLKDPTTHSQSAGYFIVFTLWIVSAMVSTCFTFTWDIAMDWGLFKGKYKLRQELIYKHKIFYILAIIEDLVFRALWTLNISVGEAGSSILEGNILGTVLAVLEVFRRFVWNFFRLENEHLNNCGEFRAVRTMSIHQFDLSDLQAHDEQFGAEPVMREHLRLVSNAFVELEEGSTGQGLLRLGIFHPRRSLIKRSVPKITEEKEDTSSTNVEEDSVRGESGEDVRDEGGGGTVSGDSGDGDGVRGVSGGDIENNDDDRYDSSVC